MPRQLLAAGWLAACALLLWVDPTGAAPRRTGAIRQVEMDGNGQGVNVNIIVRELRVTPIHARVGEVVRVEMVTEDREDLVPETRDAKIYANGKVVARKLVTYGFGGEGERIRRETFLWDTRGHKPGEYRIKGEVFVFTDASPFDNSLEVGEPLVLVLEGTAFPPGVTEGGSAVARDPRYKPASPPAQEEGRPAKGSGGY